MNNLRLQLPSTPTNTTIFARSVYCAQRRKTPPPLLNVHDNNRNPIAADAITAAPTTRAIIASDDITASP